MDSPQAIAAKAKKAVEGFLEGLRQGGSGDPREFLQVTLRGIQNPKMVIPHFLAFEVGKCRRPDGAGDVVREVEVKLLLAPHNDRPRMEMAGALRVICETGPMKPGLDGEWGVCPMSFRPRKA